MLLSVGAPGYAHALGESTVRAAAVEAAAAAAAPASAERAGNPRHAYADRSDEELAALAANWNALGQPERRALLTEMKRRMARKGDHSGVIHIRTERRYGRIIRQPDGRVIRVETQVVHVRPIDEKSIDEPVRQGYGIGFERRVARREADGSRGQVATDGPQPYEVVPNPVLEGLESLPPTPLLDPLPVYRVSDPAP